MTVWLVWHEDTYHDWKSVVVCKDEIVAEAEVDRQCESLRKYYAPRDPEFDQQLGSRLIRTKYNDRITWGPTEVKDA
jgi:hypothetical protein